MVATPEAISRREDPGKLKGLARVSGDTKVLSPSTIDKIPEVCPQFRILVVGKCGSGKSSLINYVFGTDDARVSHTQPGDARIDDEILSSQVKTRFLLHDSRGFEYCEDGTVEAVQKFLLNRSQDAQIKDRVHAIWLCISIPIANGRLIETSVEEFLKEEVQETGQVPVIVVLTKYDRLVAAERLAMMHAGLETSLEVAKEKAKERLQKECIQPLENLVRGRSILEVSTQYEDTLDELVGTTLSRTEEYVAKAIESMH